MGCLAFIAIALANTQTPHLHHRRMAPESAMEVPRLCHDTSISPSRPDSPSRIQASHLSSPPHNLTRKHSELPSAPSCSTIPPPAQLTTTKHPEGALNSFLPQSHPDLDYLPTPTPRPLVVTRSNPNANKTSLSSSQGEAVGSAGPSVNSPLIVQSPLFGSPVANAVR